MKRLYWIGYGIGVGLGAVILAVVVLRARADRP